MLRLCTGELIDEVKEYPVLYNPNHCNYKYPHMKDEAWGAIARKLNQTDIDVKKRWKNLKDTYVKYQKSIDPLKNPKKSYRRWIWASQMDYFQPYFHLAADKYHKSEDFLSTSSQQNDLLTPKQEESIVTFGYPSDDDYEDQDFVEDKSTLENVDPLLKKSPIDDFNETQTTNGKSTKRKLIEFYDGEDDYDSSLTVPATTSSDYIDINRRNNGFNHPIDMIFAGYAEIVKTFSPERQAVTKLELAKIISQQEIEHCQEQKKKQIKHELNDLNRDLQ